MIQVRLQTQKKIFSQLSFVNLLIKIIELKNGNWRGPNVDNCEWINQEKL